MPFPAGRAAVLWRRLDRPGHESARLLEGAGARSLSGYAAFDHEGSACGLAYRIDCDPDWRTRSAVVEGWLGEKPILVRVEADRSGKWLADGAAVPAVEGCVDVDLNFSPSTNLLPIRRLALPVGGEATVRAAWLRFPGFALEPLEQTYRRLAEDRYLYRSAGGRFERELEVDRNGFVLRYPGFWEIAS
ncbi:MAG TPA: putative glycolipid-binding domain-containing protein [Thermoanaerobaculia bacterium]|nr:putative glycolipid-binding domain-containing protein [Thermoanaerobaculia bacterium]